MKIVKMISLFFVILIMLFLISKKLPQERNQKKSMKY